MHGPAGISISKLPDIPWSDLVSRYRAGLPETLPFAYGAAAALLVLSIPLLLPRPAAPKWLRYGLLLPVLGFALWWGWQLLWIGDDAFISFRYAENFAYGRGLVFNAGERVEGYTNFLWTVLIAAGIKLGQNPIHVSIVLSMSSFVAVILLADDLVRRLAPWRAPVSLSFTAPLIAVNYVTANYATSGLETMFGAALVLGMLRAALSHRPMLAGTLGILATMSHPDHAVFYASLGLVLLFDAARRRGLLWYAVPFVVIFLPYFAWRTSYYGDFFPNTYYAKSGDRIYFDQGWIYVAVTIVGGSLFGALPVAIFGALRRRRHFIARYFMVSTVVFTLYVAKIGGDFMLGRLFVPVIPVLFIMAELGARELFAARRRWLAAAGMVAIVPVLLAALPVKIIRPAEKAWHIADERTFYGFRTDGDLVPMSGYVQWARNLVTYVKTHDVRPLVAFGSCGMIAYYSRLPLLDVFGLADKGVARKPVDRRGRPGHEKIASAGYIVARGARIAEHAVYPPPYDVVSEIFVDGHRFAMPVFDSALADRLKNERRLRFVDARLWIDGWQPPQPDPRRERLWCDAWFMEQYYFDHNPDPLRRAAVRQKLVNSQPELAGLEPLLLDLSPKPAGFRQVRAFRFDSRGEGWAAFGESFADWPTLKPIPLQDTVIGFDGGYANAMVHKKGDTPTGRLVSTPFVIEGDAITLRVGGGMHTEAVRVSLLVDGARARDATGCRSEMMGARVWPTADLKGKQATIEIFDNAAGAWGHLMVDEIIEWRREGR